ncbi:MAG: peroxiredoxin, partial [Ignavibacteria bacterium CG08_land_8_20_14_0_20_37_9]
MIEEGKKAPTFKLSDQNGKVHSLKDYLGKKVVLYFYPKDNTPGCTTEACSFRDEFPTFKKNNTVILGVSADPVKSHKNFSDKFGLPFPLLSDVSK